MKIILIVTIVMNKIILVEDSLARKPGTINLKNLKEQKKNNKTNKYKRKNVSVIDYVKKN